MYGKDDDTPEFGTEWWLPHNDKRVKFWSYSNEEWMKIDHYLAKRELAQSMGRGACRGVPTIMVTNCPLDGYPIQSVTWGNLIGNVRVNKQTAESRLYEAFEPDLTDEEIYLRAGLQPTTYTERLLSEIRNTL